MWSITREVDVHPLHHFRESMQSSGLLRKYQGRLLLTRLGKQVVSDPASRWVHLRDRLVPDEPRFDAFAGIAILLHAATTPDKRLAMDSAAEALGLLGWEHSDGHGVTAADIWPVWNDLWATVGNVGAAGGRALTERTPSPAALSLIRDALLHEAPGLHSPQKAELLIHAEAIMDPAPSAAELPDEALVRR